MSGNGHMMMIKNNSDEVAKLILFLGRGGVTVISAELELRAS